MPSGAHYRILTAVGKQDNIITALEFLKKRLRSIKLTKEKAGQSNTKPTLSDLEESHMFFLRRKFRPYLLLANEYLRVSGNTASFGQPSNISIEMYGDYLADIAIMITINAASIVPVTGAGANSSGFAYVENFVPALIKKVFFRNQSITISEVAGEYFYVYENVLCPFNHLSSLSRMFAETVEQAYGDLYVDGVDTSPKIRLDGPQLQERKTAHDSFDICIPAPFFFCENISAAIPICAFPTTKKEVVIELNDVNHITTLGYDVVTVTNGSDPSTYRLGSQNTWATAPSIRSINLWVDYVFLPSWLTDIVSERISFFLIRNVSTTQCETTAASGYFEPGVNYPIEYMFVGFCPTSHIAGHEPASGEVASAETLFADYDPGKRYFDWTNNGEPMFTTISIHSGETYFFKDIPPLLSNSYFYLKFGGDCINSPKKKDIHFFNFAAYPGMYQPSGTLNCGRVAGLRVDWNSAVIGASLGAGLAAASAICFVFTTYLNFFLVVEGGASIKYTA